MMVAVGLFSIVMLISTTALLSLVDANRKAQALQSVMNNLNTAVDGMVRAMRMGTNYHCGLGGDRSVPFSDPNGNPCSAIVFEAVGGVPGSLNLNDQWVYRFEVDRIYKSEDNNSTFYSLTAPEVLIDSASFYVVGAEQGDNIQPKVVVVVRGTAGAAKAKTRTSFNIQATAVQRVIDI